MRRLWAYARLAHRRCEAAAATLSSAIADGYAIVQALKARGVVGDFRTPNFVRLGIAPLYLSYAELWDAVQRLKAIMHTREWDQERFRVRATVT